MPFLTLDWISSVIPCQANVELSGELQRVRLERFLYARHGRDLMGCKFPVCEPWYCRETGP